MATSTAESQELPGFPTIKTDWEFMQLPTVRIDEYLAGTDNALALMGKEVISILDNYVGAIPALAEMTPQEVAMIVHALAVWGLDRRHEGIDAGRELQLRLHDRARPGKKVAAKRSASGRTDMRIAPSGRTQNQEARRASKARQDAQAREHEAKVRKMIEERDAEAHKAAEAHETEQKKLADVPILTDQQIRERLRLLDRGEELAPLC